MWRAEKRLMDDIDETTKLQIWQHLNSIKNYFDVVRNLDSQELNLDLDARIAKPERLNGQESGTVDKS